CMPGWMAAAMSCSCPASTRRGSNVPVVAVVSSWAAASTCAQASMVFPVVGEVLFEVMGGFLPAVQTVDGSGQGRCDGWMLGWRFQAGGVPKLLFEGPARVPAEP